MTGALPAPQFRLTVNGSRLSAELSATVTSVLVEHEADTLDRFSVTLANAYPALPWTHSGSADLLRIGSPIVIDMGYVDDLHRLFDGEITTIRPDFPLDDTPTVQVGGYTRLHRLRAGNRTRTFQNVSDEQIARLIAADVGLTVDAERTGITYPYLLQFNQTDLAFLTERARAIRFEVTVEGRTLSFRRERNDLARSATLAWGNQLTSFQATMNGLGPVGAVVVRGYDPGTKAAIEGRAGTGDEDSTMAGTRSGAEAVGRAFHRVVTEVRVDRPVISRDEADRLARAAYNERALDFVTGTGSCAGRPDVRAGRVIELTELGPALTGLYYVTRSTHRIDDTGYQTTFSLRRNAT